MINNLIDFPQLYSIYPSKNDVNKDLELLVTKYFIEEGPIHVLTSKIRSSNFSEGLKILNEFYGESKFLCIKVFDKEYVCLKQLINETKEYNDTVKNALYELLKQMNSLYHFLMMFLKISEPLFDSQKIFDLEDTLQIYGDEEIAFGAVIKFCKNTFADNGLVSTCFEDFKKRDFAQLKLNSHSLKGRARYVGLLRFGERAASLQKASELLDAEESYACLKDVISEGQIAVNHFIKRLNFKIEISENFFSQIKEKLEMSMIHLNIGYPSSAFDENWKESHFDCFIEDEIMETQKYQYLFSSAFQRIKTAENLEIQASEYIPQSASLKPKKRSRNSSFDKTFTEEFVFRNI